MKLDDFSPAYIGEDRITLVLDQNSTTPKVFTPVQVNVDYSFAAPQGVALPLELVIQGPTEASFIERTYRRFAPETISFKPIAAGVHLVLLREVAHNRWVGRLRVEVIGDPFEQV